MRYIIKTKNGFTMMEMLVVIALSMILMGLVMAPVIQSFNLTRRAESLVDAQDSARTSMSMITRDFSQAMFVYDNQSSYTNLPTYDKNTAATTNIKLYYAKIDMVLPKMIMHCNNPNHPAASPRDYSREETISGVVYEYDLRPCPACKAAGLDANMVEVRPKLPMQQSGKLVRYFLALKNNDPTITAFGWNSKDEKTISDNPVVLYRAEYDPQNDNLFPSAMSVADRLNYENFFYDNTDAPNGKKYWENWAKVAKPIGISHRQDLVNTTFDTNGVLTSLQPTVTFKFTMVDNEALSGAYINDVSNDYPGTVPTAFRGKYGYWAWSPQCSIEVIRDDPSTNYSNNGTSIPDIVYRTESDPNNGHVIIKKYLYDGTTYNDEGAIFDISQYRADGSLSITPPGGKLEMAFLIDYNRGTVNFALPASSSNNTVDAKPLINNLDTSKLNSMFNENYAVDMGSARRGTILRPFADSDADVLYDLAQLVPGTEKVAGADFYNINNSLTYSRVPLGLGDPKANQYKIDYDSRYLEFASSPANPLPETQQIGVQYLIHFNKSTDIVRATYITKSLVSVNLGIRLFDPIAGKANIVSVTQNVLVGNALR